MASTTATEGRHVFITGATGLLGRRLLMAHLEQGDEVSILLRPKSRQALKYFRKELPRESRAVLDRAHVLEGDLTDASVIADDDERRRLLETVTDIYHLGGAVHLAALRETAFDVNVTGTRNMLALARHAPRLRRFHYTGCTLVAGDARGLFYEDQLRLGQELGSAYAESKMVAEGHVQDESSVPWTVYRLGALVGDTTEGRVDKIDGIYYGLMPLVRLASNLPGPLRILPWAPGGDRVFLNIAPIDWVVQAMMAIGLEEESERRTYHLVDPHPMTVREFLDGVCQELGMRGPWFDLPVLPFAELARTEPVTTAWKLIDNTLGVPREAMDYLGYRVRFDTTHATALVRRLGVPCPHLSSYLPQLVQYAREHLVQGRFNPRLR